MRVSSPLDSAYLNRCDQEAMNSIVPYFDRDLRHLAETTADRIAMFPQRFAREHQHYQENAAILLLSSLWITTKVFFLKCGLLKHPCNFWKICPYCAHKKRMDILAKFLPVFDSHPGRWGFVTLSFKRCHYCGDCHQGAPHEHPHVHHRDEEQKRRLKALGYRVVEIWPDRLEAGLRDLAQRLDRPDLAQ